MSGNCQKVVKAVSFVAAQGMQKVYRPASHDHHAKFASQNVAGGRLGDGLEKMDLPRVLEVCQAIGHKQTELLLELTGLRPTS